MDVSLRNDFIEMEQFNLTENTCKAYVSAINTFYAAMQEIKERKYDSDEDLVKDTSVRDFEKFFKKIVLEDEVKKSTANLKIIGLRKFFNYAKKVGVIEKDPSLTVKTFNSSKINKEKIIKETLTIPEMKKILNCSYIRGKGERNFEWNSVRDRFMLALFMTTGLRESEIVSIKMNDIEETELGYVVNVKEEDVKNNMDKRVPITEGIKLYFKEYYNALRVEGYKGEYLFFTKNGNKMCHTDVEKVIKKLIKKADIEKKITSHCFRHTLTQILLRKNVPEAMIYKILGWSDQKMISNYKGAANNKEDDQAKFTICNILA